MDPFTLTIAVEHNFDVFYSILQFLLPHRPERSRELWRNGGQPAEIDTAACLEALRCCNKRWRAFFAEVLPDGHFLWRQLLKQLHIGRHGPALVRFADLVNAHTENINYKERFWLALKKPYEYVTKPLVLSMFRLLARRAEEALRDGVPFSKKFDNEARGCSHALVWTLQSSAGPRGQETRAELLIEFEEPGHRKPGGHKAARPHPCRPRHTRRPRRRPQPMRAARPSARRRSRSRRSRRTRTRTRTTTGPRRTTDALGGGRARGGFPRPLL
ncbi:hypothetical protein EMIHUDRAFT_457577 [Emiliania huxleyi CCMP1516]|uniref:F-box domain-containing protein n=2 Tax=Emiliania huxleyi TaxID=2903 RepID=A0A0D3JPC2_EMIH1|nr:hypothetical protein EMIHUDRAFT_457577 [Emiliania huxleyi CCMP1516]EOD25357.1 hypothetical protein EMIHUDRAFT_457577 [Emiliania huxleyi CCMP1516]|eukprot:XP_005777786.1 hypothetical protein EMIHUDRAFT_457577 [Emiliania huxleyi CCMP1516]